jgi:hypothetical protein
MQETFNIALGIERVLALHYFCGHFQNFIPIQKSASSDRVFKRVFAASWDLLLINLPAYLLFLDPADGVTLGFPCTSDRALCSIGHACSLEMVMAWKPRENRPLPILSYDLRILEKTLGKDIVDQIIMSDFEWQESRRQRDLHSENHISFESLQKLTEELEQQIANYCRS